MHRSAPTQVSCALVIRPVTSNYGSNQETSSDRVKAHRLPPCLVHVLFGPSAPKFLNREKLLIGLEPQNDLSQGRLGHECPQSCPTFLFVEPHLTENRWRLFSERTAILAAAWSLFQ